MLYTRRYMYYLSIYYAADRRQYSISITWWFLHTFESHSHDLIYKCIVTLMCRVEEKRAAHRMRGFNKTKMCCNFPQLDTSGLVTLKYSILKYY